MAILIFALILLAAPIFWQIALLVLWRRGGRPVARILLVQAATPIVYFCFSAALDPDRLALLQTGLGPMMDALVSLAASGCGYLATAITIGFVIMAWRRRNRQLLTAARLDGRP
ncbi:hypothetical protein [Chromobacterium sp.]|uniref:hypothetical protein n=1 Tax=Chromobacterium sp. TaxID=306190 RepID=UPI0035AF8414